MQLFRQWRRDNGLPPDAPITASHACRWLSELADLGGRCAATLAVYVSALSSTYIEECHPDDTRPNPMSSQTLRRLLKGIAAVKATMPVASSPQSAPLTFDLAMKFVYTDGKQDTMHRAAIRLAVAATLRPSELLGSRDLPERALRRHQVVFYSDAGGTQRLEPGGSTLTLTPHFLILTLLRTKTQPKGTTKVVSARAAVTALWQWYCATSDRLPDTLLFTNRGRPLTTWALLADVRRRAAAVGLGHIFFTGKCARRGGASTLAMQGIDAEDIAAQGWTLDSSQWKRYADDPAVQLQRQIAVNQRMDFHAGIRS